jgi:hypothetical protein
MKRRTLLSAATAFAASTAMGQTKLFLTQRPSCRVIIDNDFAGDPDGLIALAHQVMSPKARTVLITTSALDAKLAAMAGLAAGRTAAVGHDLAAQLLKRLGQARLPPILTGAEQFGTGDAQVTQAARAIAAEAMRDDPLPLMLACGGPLTNVAAALRLRPEIAGRMTVIWIGGSSAIDGGVEYNLSTDIEAARLVLEKSTVPVWQVPEGEYKRFQISVAEMSASIRSISPVARWLYDQYRNLPPFVQLGGSITFGDSPLVSLTCFPSENSQYETRTVRAIKDDSRYGAEIEGRAIRVYTSLDVRLNIADFTAALRLHSSRKTRNS